jgi:hypothetical protein
LAKTSQPLRVEAHADGSSPGNTSAYSYAVPSSTMQVPSVSGYSHVPPSVKAPGAPKTYDEQSVAAVSGVKVCPT